MSFNRGFLKDKITVWEPENTESGYGGTTLSFKEGRTIRANVDYLHGKRAMQNGQIDAYQYKFVRCDYHSFLTDRCRIKFEDRFYVIDSGFNKDKQKNEMQFNMFEVEDINKVISQS